MELSIFPDESFLYNTNHLGEKFYKYDSRWNALRDKPIRELTEEVLEFGCTAVSTNGLAIYRLETKRRELLKMVDSLQEFLNHGQLSNSDMHFIEKGILETFDSIYQNEERKNKERKEKTIVREMNL